MAKKAKRGRPRKKDNIMNSCDFIGGYIPITDVEFVNLYKVAKQKSTTTILKQAIYHWRVDRTESRNDLIYEIRQQLQREWNYKKHPFRYSKDNDYVSGLFLKFKVQVSNVLAAKGVQEDTIAIIISDIRY